ncbi:acetyltransferase [Desulfosporosinus acidiphilus SJ4]|uniref:Acetyltransferase n=1 Tax=Desulfosporosinus acidiphilus (strain DSM 22704 / JCM 16185 / SJ4) TaxID=646529 RepID=I4D5S7_DESAJ|nr:GNAT family N-acetyltransferase [Desulfosporosinus acidiphilus]AFM41151.1 acetyltransferase [Desulfosporosinus acidiphilus SJ4]
MLRRAIINDIPQIMAIIRETILEMHSYQNYQWDENYPQQSDFEVDIRAGNLFVKEREGNLAAFICVNRVEPEEYSTLQWSSPQEGMVIHRMSVHPNYRRCGLASELMQFAETLAQSLNFSYLKTDTNSKNEKMKSLFQKCGYRFVGEINFMGKEAPFYCYDKIIRA